MTEANGQTAPRIAVLDYGMGNLRSVEKALARVGADVRITADHAEARVADGLILPGVGAFPAAMERIRERELDALLDEPEVREKPILGICLGMQLIFSASTELGGAAGLGLVDGEVSELRAEGLKVPHIGWSPVRWEQSSRLADGIASETPFYFVHSFAPRPAGETVLGTAAYGERFACAIEQGNVFGVQFHPEKSSVAGLRALSNFVRICSGLKAPRGTAPTRA